VVAFCLKFLSGYGDTSLDTFKSTQPYGATAEATETKKNCTKPAAAAAAANATAKGGEAVAEEEGDAAAGCDEAAEDAKKTKKEYISYGLDPEREGGLGLQRLVRLCGGFEGPVCGGIGV
jgi:hypothetical protein